MATVTANKAKMLTLAHPTVFPPMSTTPGVTKDYYTSAVPDPLATRKWLEVGPPYAGAYTGEQVRSVWYLEFDLSGYAGVVSSATLTFEFNYNAISEPSGIVSASGDINLYGDWGLQTNDDTDADQLPVGGAFIRDLHWNAGSFGVAPVPITVNLAGLTLGGTVGLRMEFTRTNAEWVRIEAIVDTQAQSPSGALGVPPYLTFTFAPAPVACHVVQSESPGAAASQCPVTATNGVNAVSGQVWLPGNVAQTGTCLVSVSHSAAWRDAGGPLGSVSTEPEAVTLGPSGTFSVNLPPQGSLCPFNASILQSAQTVTVALPSGYEASFIVPDAATGDIAKLVSGQAVALAPAHYTCLVSFDEPGTPYGAVYVRLSAPAYWQQSAGTGVLLDSEAVLVKLDASGLGSVLLPPQAALTGPAGTAIWWEFMLPGAKEWVRASVPDAGTAAFPSGLILEGVAW